MNEILKVVAWPVAVIGCFVFACIYFRKQMCALLDRTTSVGKDGLRASPPTGQTTQELDKVRQAQQLVEALTSPAIREREDLIRKELKERGLEEATETEKVLVRYLATTQLIVAFEELYRIIFGSQIFLLKAANENRAGGLSEAFVIEHFANAQRYFAPTFDQWKPENYVNFLLTSGLLIKTGSSFAISHLGVDFLEWITKIGAPERKGM